MSMLRGKERLEDALIAVDPGARVVNLDRDLAASCRSGDDDLARPSGASLDGLDRVPDEVEQHLLELDRVTRHLR